MCMSTRLKFTFQIRTIDIGEKTNESEQSDEKYRNTEGKYDSDGKRKRER